MPSQRDTFRRMIPVQLALIADGRCVHLKGFVALSTVILLPACGGSTTGPSSPAGITLLSANPAPGATITLGPSCSEANTTQGCAEVLTAPVTLSFSILSDHDYGASLDTVQLRVDWGSQAKPCGAHNPGHREAPGETAKDRHHQQDRLGLHVALPLADDGVNDGSIRDRLGPNTGDGSPYQHVSRGLHVRGLDTSREPISRLRMGRRHSQRRLLGRFDSYPWHL